MTVPCYPIPGVSAAAGSAARGHARHVHHAGHGGGVGHSGHGPAAIHHAPVQHLPVYGPPPPTVAAHCVRIPGELPAFPGGQVFGTGVSSAGGVGGSAGAGVVGGGALGLAQAAMVAAGLGLAAVGASALLPKGGAAPVESVSVSGPISTTPPPADTTAPGLPYSFPMMTPLPDASPPMDRTTNVPGEGPRIEKPKETVPPPATTTATSVPEPGTLYLLAAGVLAVFGGHRMLRGRAGR